MPDRALMHDSYAIAQAGYDAAIAEAEHAHRQAEIVRDVEQMAVAQQNIVALRNQKQTHESMSRELARSMQPDPDANRYGLSATEQAIARSGFRDDEEMTDDQRDQVYAANKQRYHANKSRGLHDQSQGHTGR